MDTYFNKILQKIFFFDSHQKHLQRKVKIGDNVDNADNEDNGDNGNHEDNWEYGDQGRNGDHEDNGDKRNNDNNGENGNNEINGDNGSEVINVAGSTISASIIFNIFTLHFCNICVSAGIT